MQGSLDATFAALADPTRRRVIDVLRKRPERSSDIAMRCETSHPAMSKHLRVLRTAGLVKETIDRDDARIRVYELCEAPFLALRGWLDEVEAFWGDQLVAFKAHAERRKKKRP
jgi:DNA-binding transcriptional ArsR family regulator